MKSQIMRQQRQKLDLTTLFFIGIICGVILSQLVRHSGLPLTLIASENITRATSNTASNSDDKTSAHYSYGSANESNLAERLSRQVRVMCIVLTAPKRHKTHAIHVKRTWGRHCNQLLFMSSAASVELGAVKLAVREGYTNQWNKTRESLRHVYERHLQAADWFLLIDDNTYVILENLRGLLYAYAAEAPIYFGTKQQATKLHIAQSDDAGYVLSKAALSRFMQLAYPNAKLCRQLPFGFQDKELERCLHNVGVYSGIAYAAEQLQQFYAWSPLQAFNCCWSQQHIDHKAEHTQEQGAAHAIAFHNTHANEFYILEYFIYKLSPFGIARPMEVLPAKLNQTVSF